MTMFQAIQGGAYGPYNLIPQGIYDTTKLDPSGTFFTQSYINSLVSSGNITLNFDVDDAAVIADVADNKTKVISLLQSVDSKVKIGNNVNKNVTADKPFLEISSEGGAAGLHLTNSLGFTGPYIIGIGKDYDGLGMMLPNKANGRMISGEQRATVTDINSEWLKVTQSSINAPLIRLEQNVEGAAAALQLQAFGTTTAAQHLLYVGNQQGEIGKIYSSDGALTWLKDIKVHDVNSSGGKLKLMSGAIVGQQSHILGDSKGFEWYNYSGSPNIWYPFSIKANSNTLSIQAGANANAVGGATYTSIISIQNTKLGFFGATPVTKRTGVAVTVDAIHAALVSLGLISA
ncbi:hypothetical protein CPT_Silence6 [Bacillus phage Silence]|nr:hypothetical protein CPT_Silence6 [Bacillus phage Silence]